MPRAKQDRSPQSPHWARKAERINAKASAQTPLFPEPVTDAQREFRRWRRNISEGVERLGQVYCQAVRGLNLLTERALIRLVAQHLSPDTIRTLTEKIHSTYPDGTYWISAWIGLLTGERFVGRLSVQFDPAKITRYNSDGRYVVEEDVIQLQPAPYTREELHRRFTYREPPGQAPDDGGLAERLSELSRTQEVS